MSRLGDHADVRMGQSPPGSSCNADGTGLPLLNGPTEFGDHHPVPVQFTTAPQKFARAGDILFCVRGSTTGRMNWADRDYAIGRGVAAISHKRDRALQPLVKAAIEYRLGDVLAQATGSTFPNVSRDQLLNLSWPVDPAVDERAVAGLLGGLNNKVELNRRMSATIERLMRTLFASSFGTVDPGRAPNGWTVASLSDHIDVTRGLSYSGAGLADDGIPLHNLDSVANVGGYRYEGIKYYRGDYQPRHVVRAGDLLVVNTDLTWAFQRIAQPALVPQQFADLSLFSHHLFRVRPKSGSWLTGRFVYLALMSPRLRQVMVGYSNGTTVNMLPSDALQRPRIAVPPVELVQRFDEMAQPLFARQEQLQLQSETLARLRDLLLPQLMSGEIRLKEAEKAAAEAV